MPRKSIENFFFKGGGLTRCVEAELMKGAAKEENSARAPFCSIFSSGHEIIELGVVLERNGWIFVISYGKSAKPGGDPLFPSEGGVPKELKLHPIPHENGFWGSPKTEF